MAIVRCWMADLHDRMVWLCLELCQARKPLIASAVSASMSARSRGFRECGTVDGGGGGGYISLPLMMPVHMPIRRCARLRVRVLSHR